jgi:hypothetical protein
MPASMMMPASGGRKKVIGKSTAMVAVGPIPGRTPIRVPSSAPSRQKARLAGVIASPNPSMSRSKNSICSSRRSGFQNGHSGTCTPSP